MELDIEEFETRAVRTQVSKSQKSKERKGNQYLSLKAPMLMENGSSYFNFINNYSPNPLILIR